MYKRQELKYLGYPILELNSSNYSQIPDELSGEFRIGNYRRLKRSIPQKTSDQYFKFTFVRNPYDRLVSSWTFLTSEHRGSAKINVSFPTFVNAIANSDYASLSPDLSKEEYVDLEWHTMPMFRHLTNESGKIIIDFIGRVEQFEKDWSAICEKLELPKNSLSSPHVNSSQHRPFQEYYTPELKEIVYRIYKEDFEQFNYEP